MEAAAVVDEDKSSNNSVDINELVNVYLTIRREREILSEQFKAKDRELDNDLTAIEQVLLQECNKINANSINTPQGTIVRSVKDTYTCIDWGNFKQFVLETGAIDVLQQRIHQTNLKEFMNQHEGEGLPPGLNVSREFTVIVRKPSVRSSI
jgi:hypothetical protein